MSRRHYFPLEPIKKIIREDCSYHISTEAAIALRDILEEIGSTIAKNAVKEFKKLNKCRKQQKLRPLKRLSSWSIHRAYIINFIKLKNNICMGSRPEEIGNPGSESMSKDEIIAKPGKSTDDEEEVD